MSTIHRGIRSSGRPTLFGPDGKINLNLGAPTGKFSAAEKLYNVGQARTWCVGGAQPRVFQNRTRFSRVDYHGVYSRVIHVCGLAEHLTQQSLEQLFSDRFTYDIDKIVDRGPNHSGTENE
ncbi:hypothetical protein AAE478_000475 [Parahypoxylon ruwenzoriense]